MIMSTRYGACVGGSSNRSAISVVLKFWCNWQMRQSLHPVVLVARFFVCSLSTCAALSGADRRMRLCR